MKVRITDVFLRDGLQDEDVVVSTADKLAIAEALVAAGVDRIEAGSFVNPKKVPQMGDAPEVFAGLPAAGGITDTALALNGRGIQRAVDAGVRHISVVTSASQAHSSANAGQSIEDALASLGEEVARHPQNEAPSRQRASPRARIKQRPSLGRFALDSPSSRQKDTSGAGTAIAPWTAPKEPPSRAGYAGQKKSPQNSKGFPSRRMR